MDVVTRSKYEEELLLDLRPLAKRLRVEGTVRGEREMVLSRE